ncbi:MAG: ATP-binding protein [bacterium]|nr:ATP-binding protein [bacterium]
MQITLRNYKFIRCLQESEVNSTSLAVDHQGNEVLVRAVRRDVLSDSWMLRMEHEVKRLARVQSAHFSPPRDIGIEQGWAYLIYRRIHGTPLSRLISQGTLDQVFENRTDATIRIAESCLRGLQAVHELGLVHRDLRPSHVIMDADASFVVAGYGPICIADAFGRQGNQAIEFARYASPELTGSIDHDLSPASDLYSLGALLFAGLLGRPPFDGKDVGEIMFQHLTRSPSFGGLSEDVPGLLVEFIRRLMEKEVRDRYQSAESALKDLAKIRSVLNGELAGSAITIGRHDSRSELTEPSFVGRTEEMSIIDKELSEVASGRFQTLIAISRSGMGKSRLLLEAIRNAARHEFRVFRSVASDQATQEPLGPLLDIVDSFARQLSYSKNDAQQAMQALEEHRSEIALAMPALARALGWGASELQGPEELGQGRVIAAFCKVLEYCTLGRPTLVCIDDCQWLDKPSLRVLEALVLRRPANMFLLIGSRPNEGMSEQLLQRLEGARQLEFGELDVLGIHALVESMAGPLPDKIKAVVAAMSEGSPFLATAAMRGLVESEALIPAARGWRIDEEQLADFQAAGDSANVLLKRLQFVDHEASELLSIGAVVGKQFDVEIPLALTSIDAERVFQRLRKVRDQGLIWSKPDGTVAFVHDKIREAVVSRLAEPRRRDLHFKVAQYLLEKTPSRCFDLAYHFDEACMPQQAWPHALKAANEARARYALDSAEVQFRIAARALSDQTPANLCGEHHLQVAGRAKQPSSRCTVDRESQYQIESGLAKVLLLLGKYEEAEQWLTAALQSAPSALDEAKIRYRQGELAFKRGDKELALQRFECALAEFGEPIPKHRLTLMLMFGRELIIQALHTLFPAWLTDRRANPPEERRLVWRLYSKLCHCYWYVRDKNYTFWAHLSELNEAEIYEPTPELAQAYSEHAPGMSLIPWQSRGLEYARRSLNLRKKSGDLWGQGQSRNFLSIMFYSGARFDECINQAQQAISVLERTGDYWEIHMAQYQAAASLYRLGQLRESLDAAKALYESAIRRGDDQSSGNAVDLWARASLGRVPSEILQREAARELRDHQGQCHVFLACGVQAHYAGDYDAAIGHFRQSIAAVKRTGVLNAYITPNYAWLVTSLRARFHASHPRTERTRRRCIHEMLAAARSAVRVSYRFRNELPHAYRELAAVEALRGRCYRAFKLLDKSMRIARQQGAEYEYALSSLMRCELLSEWADRETYRSELLAAREIIANFEDSVSDQAASTSLSLIDRFEVLLDAGREINSATDQETILKRTLEACKRLLRGDRVLLIECDERAPNRSFEVVEAIGSSCDFDPQILSSALACGATVVEPVEHLNRHGMKLEQRGAFLACPIRVSQNCRFALYVANTHLTNLFADDEKRIANYLASSASGALERADGFAKLEQLNENLEARVMERTEAVTQRSRELEATANELRQTQVQLEMAKTAAEKASASKSEFLACMSHEIRTPMNAVLGFTEILLTRRVSAQDREKYLQRIHSNGQHLLCLLNSVLDFSKFEAGRLLVESVTCNPLELVTDAVSTLASRAEEKELRLDVEVEDQIPEAILSDPTRLRQIVINLVGNAIKFTHKGFVKLTLGFEQVQDRGMLLIRVADSGIGIDPVQLQDIFEPFTQADASTSRRFGGTGLGLSISKKLAEALGGDISVTSKLGEGSVFTARVGTGDLENNPMVKAEPKCMTSEMMPVHTSELRLQGASILVVDDIEENRELVCFLLKEAGAAVSIASDGQEAVQAVNSLPDLDLIFMDMQMPVMDGYTATRTLRQKGCVLPIIAMTANNMLGDEEKCLQAGCDDFVSKPIEFDVILSKAATAINKNGVGHSEANAGREAQQAKVMDLAPSNSNHNDVRGYVEIDEELDAVMAKLGRAFLEEIGERWDELKHSVTELDTGSLKQLAHWIRGTGATFGFEELANCMERMEQAIDIDDVLQIQKTFQEFASEYEKAVGAA